MIRGPNLPGKPITITSWRDPSKREWHLTMNGETVTIRDVTDLVDYQHRAAQEWLLVKELWRKEREDCGCVTCLEELSGTNV